jgi:hypothetical protein
MSERAAVDGKIDRQHVTLEDDVASLYWEIRLGAARQDIESAIMAVGQTPAAVEQWLRDAHKSHIRPETTPVSPH